MCVCKINECCYFIITLIPYLLCNFVREGTLSKWNENWILPKIGLEYIEFQSLFY